MEKLAKATRRVLSELNYEKTTFLKEHGKEHDCLVWFLTF
jgi:hypothetical protein